MGQMVNKKSVRKSEAVKESLNLTNDAVTEEYKKPAAAKIKNKSVKKSGVASKKRKKVD
jgi:hypothetical protein